MVQLFTEIPYSTDTCTQQYLLFYRQRPVPILYRYTSKPPTLQTQTNTWHLLFYSTDTEQYPYSTGIHQNLLLLNKCTSILSILQTPIPQAIKIYIYTFFLSDRHKNLISYRYTSSAPILQIHTNTLYSTDTHQYPLLYKHTNTSCPTDRHQYLLLYRNTPIPLTLHTHHYFLIYRYTPIPLTL